ncbi:protein Gir2p [[Candida] jaroonii]|uniref:Protein Gir2p n=1 Tax=[Candida] jaroonii TaxID=467808 RepID=A0ACA9Y4E1_9ASCO|nr:protein Gir2p [[Candida] jaroonii]
MDPLEEQAQELEVLESIYPDELVKHSESKFDLLISLDTASNRNHSIKLKVTYPSQYPDEIPILELETISSDEDDEDDDSDDDEEAKQNKRIINLPELVEFTNDDLRLLESKLNEEATMQLGIPSVFALATLLKDEAETLFTKKLETLENKRQDELNKQEAELSKKFIGTKVTKESFESWRENFRKEMHIDEKLELFYKNQHQGKLSGREIFEKGLANEEDIDIESLKLSA